MEEDLLGYMDWLTQAEDIEAATGGGSALKIDVSKQKGDPVVMGLLKSTMFPLQQVLEGKMGCWPMANGPMLQDQDHVLEQTADTCSKTQMSLYWSS